MLIGNFSKFQKIIIIIHVHKIWNYAKPNKAGGGGGGGVGGRLAVNYLHFLEGSDYQQFAVSLSCIV